MNLTIPLIDQGCKNCDLISSREYNRAISYLVGNKFILFDDGKGFNDDNVPKISLRSKGIDEVYQNFPNLPPSKYSPIGDTVDLLQDIDGKEYEILKKIDDIKNMERYLQDLKNDVEIIKTILSERLPEEKEPEIQDVLRELIASPNIHTFYTLLVRFAKNPKTKELFKELLLSNKSPLALPPRSII
jgi:hypothetical protein